ncbi:GNAT family N-acetyltransferase [Kocuria tytonicola]|uniref:GNAT family N-acetyltransferase n=1 Tax=Kocuria tytonicola TaxID=2055946 RepID=UPI000EF89BFA|nr:GNAT family protein [Kocuria tytonicola]RLZ02364.1 GNAT family N-acetyltransferase [Kocuria tytonicola]
MSAPFDARLAGHRALQGEKVRFRELRADDLPDLVQWWRNPEMALFQSLMVTPQPEDTVADMFRSWSTNTGAGGVGFSVVDSATDELIGHVTLYGASLPARAATLAVLIAPDHVDRGYGTDAVRLLTKFGFQEMGLHRIELRVFAYNERARAVYRKLGHVEEGTRRDIAFHGGEFHDEVIMAVLAEEWLQ